MQQETAICRSETLTAMGFPTAMIRTGSARWTVVAMAKALAMAGTSSKTVRWTAAGSVLARVAARVKEPAVDYGMVAASKLKLSQGRVDVSPSRFLCPERMPPGKMDHVVWSYSCKATPRSETVTTKISMYSSRVCAVTPPDSRRSSSMAGSPVSST